MSTGNFTSHDHKDLLHSLQQGDHIAFEHIFRQFHAALVFFANRLLSDQDRMLAEEIVQDSFMKFYERRRKFDNLQSIKAFLYITTKNACLQTIAKEHVQQRRLAKFMELADEVEEAVVQEIIYAEVLSEVSLAIDLLPEQCRKIMKKFFEEGKNAKEIAEEMGITISTVNNQKSRAIMLLRKKISSSGLLFFMFFI